MSGNINTFRHILALVPLGNNNDEDGWMGNPNFLVILTIYKCNANVQLQVKVCNFAKA